MSNWNCETITNDDALPCIEHIDHDTRTSNEIHNRKTFCTVIYCGLNTRSSIPHRPNKRRPSAERTMTTIWCFLVVYMDGSRKAFECDGFSISDRDTVDHLGTNLDSKLIGRVFSIHEKCETQFLVFITQKIYSAPFAWMEWHRKFRVHSNVKNKIEMAQQKDSKNTEIPLRLSCQRMDFALQLNTANK